MTKDFIRGSGMKKLGETSVLVLRGSITTLAVVGLILFASLVVCSLFPSVGNQVFNKIIGG